MLYLARVLCMQGATQSPSLGADYLHDSNARQAEAVHKQLCCDGYISMLAGYWISYHLSFCQTAKQAKVCDAQRIIEICRKRLTNECRNTKLFSNKVQLYFKR